MERGNSVRVLGKASLLLDALAEERELGASRLADLIGEPRSTVYRLLSTLQALELVEPGSRRGTYRLGLKLLRLGSAVVARFDERQAASPVMERLHEETEETVFLCIRRNFEAVCIERLDGRWVQSMALRLGGSLPLHVGAGPRALLAHEPRTLWDDYAHAVELERFTEHTLVTRAALVAGLEETLATGVAVSDEDVVLGIAAVGAPIFDHRGRVCASISMSGPRPTILGDAEESSRRLIAEAGAEISRSLGYVASEAAVGSGS
jgi:DNA-binding IclR family transcriptional regulator